MLQTTLHFMQLAIAPSLIQAENNVNLPNGATYILQGSTTNGNVVTNEVRIHYKEMNFYRQSHVCHPCQHICSFEIFYTLLCPNNEK